MTIHNTLRDHGQRYRPRMACLPKAESLVLQMQDPRTGVQSQPQRLVITTIPHAITGEDIVNWLSERLNLDPAESLSLGSMLVAMGYLYPLQDHKHLSIKADASLFRFQTPYFWPSQQWTVDDTDYAIYLAKRNIRKKGLLQPHEQEQYSRMHVRLNHKWDFIVLQAQEQNRAAKERKKPDRVVLEYQERAHWVVHRPPPGTVSGMDYGLDRRADPNADQASTPDVFERTLIFTQQSIMRPRVKSSVSLGALVKHCSTYQSHDPFLSGVLPSSPWITDDTTYWSLNMPSVEVPTRQRVERWTFSFGDLLSDPRGRDDFRLFLKKEFSGENLAFWESCEDLKWGAAATMKEKAEHIYKTFLARGAPRWINIDGKTMEITIKSLKHPHRYVLDAAQTHIYMLMKKDSYGRYLKSPVFKETQKKAVNPEEHKFTDSQLEQNARSRRPSLSPIVLRQLEQERRAKMAAAAPVDITQLCRFTTPIPVYSGYCSPSPPSLSSPSPPSLSLLSETTALTSPVEPSLMGPSPISLALDSTRDTPRLRIGQSLRRMLRWGCGQSSAFTQCQSTPRGGANSRVRQGQAPPRRFGNFFQLKVELPPESRIYPIESEDEEDRGPSGLGAKEIICPWENLTSQTATS
ncbi:unnamed protein product [Knipowitschia caucasica]